jgi:hypothetical protein
MQATTTTADETAQTRLCQAGSETELSMLPGAGSRRSNSCRGILMKIIRLGILKVRSWASPVGGARSWKLDPHPTGVHPLAAPGPPTRRVPSLCPGAAEELWAHSAPPCSSALAPGTPKTARQQGKPERVLRRSASALSCTRHTGLRGPLQDRLRPVLTAG